MTRSLGFATDLALRVLEGAVVEQTGGATVVRTPSNPRFRWGNFLLVPDAGDDPGRWIGAHRSAFPDAGFVTIGVDHGAAAFDERPWTTAGFMVERLAVLTAAPTSIAPPPPMHVRPLTSEEDWRSVLSIEADEGQEAEDTGYSEARLRQQRALVATGRAVWLGVEEQGAVVATAGIADAGGGSVRFQDVQTLRRARRRGCASALVAAGARVAADRFGSTRAVLVAEPAGPAIGLYRRLGFEQAETQVQLSHVDG